MRVGKNAYVDQAQVTKDVTDGALAVARGPQEITGWAEKEDKNKIHLYKLKGRRKIMCGIVGALVENVTDLLTD